MLEALLEEFDLLFSGCTRVDGGSMSRVLGCWVCVEDEQWCFFFFNYKQNDEMIFFQV